MNHIFTVEEVNLICIFTSESGAFTLESRRQVIGDMESTLPHLDDPDMEELSNRVIGKLRNMTNEEFEQLELTEAE